MTKKTKLGGRICIFLLLSGFIALYNISSSPILPIQAASSFFSEDFATTTYMDVAETNTTGWGTGFIENSKKKPSIVGSISSGLIDDTFDVFVEGDYAYVTNQGEGLKVVNITDPTNPQINGTYVTYNIAESVYVDGNYAFIADYEGDPNQENFIVLDISDPTNPIHLGNCSTFKDGNEAAWNIVTAGDIAYVANGEGGLCVIDISNPSSPEPLSYKNTAGTSYDLVVEGDYIYLADDSNGLVVFDITDPTSVSRAATYSSGISSAISVVVEGNYAYVIDFNNGIVVVNITNPISPTFAGSFSKTDVSDASIYGNYLYVTDIADGLSVVNITDPTTPILIHTIYLPGFAQAIDIDGCYAYISCQSGGFQIVRIADPSTPNYAGSYDTPDLAYDVFVSGDFAYIADWDSGGLQVLSISDSSSPTLAGSIDTPNAALGVFVSGDYAYVADHSSGLQIINITDPSSPIPAGSHDTPDLAYDVFVSGDYAYVADWGSGLLVFNISDPSSPTPAGSYNTLGSASGVVVSGDYAYVADGIQGLQVLDISNPSSPTLAGSYSTLDNAYGVFVSGDYAYLTEDTRGLRILDISVPSSPSLIGTYNLPGSFPKDVFVSGNYAYLADSTYGLQVVNISVPSSPIDIGGYNTPGSPFGVFVSGDYAYVADHDGGLQILEVRKSKVRQFASPCVAQSNTVFSASSSTITSATLFASDNTPVSTSITYSLSADGGTNWETITPELEHVFSNTGNQLKWNAILTTSVISKSPFIHNLSIEYTAKLNEPSLLTPTDGFITEDYTPTFTWNSINGETNYLFQLDTTTSFSTPLLNITLPSSSTSYTLGSPLAEDTYYWRVAGIDSEGDIGDFSNYRTLYLIQDVNAPTIDNPSDVSYEQGATGNSITWTPADSNPYWYNITLNGILTSHDDSWLGGNIVMNIDGLSLGIHTAICYVYDLEGLMVSDIVEVEVTTTAPPTIDDIADFDYEEGSTGNSITWHPSDANPDYYSITRDGTVIDDGLWLGGDINIDIDGLTYGVYTYVCFVNDTEGQSNSDTVVITVTDNAKPILNTPSDVIYDEGDTGNNIIWIATDNNPSSYIVYREGIQVDTNSWTSGSSIIISVDGLSAASYNYTIVVFDEAGNSAKDEVTVAVTPTVPEFNHSVFLAMASIALVFVFYYIKRRTHKKN